MEEIDGFVSTIYRFITALAISMPRPVAIFAVLPLTGRLGLPPFFVSIVVIAMSLPIVLGTERAIAASDAVPIGWLVLLSLKEIFIGLVIGLFISIPFWAAEAAGNIVDFVREAPDASLQDPQGTTEASITGTLFSITATFYFVAIGGLSILFNIIYMSYEIWPVLQPWPELDLNAAGKFVALLDQLLQSALLLAAPLVIFMLISLFILMIIARFTPQINVFDMSMTFRNLAFVIVLQLYALFVFEYLPGTLSGVKNVIDLVKGVIN